MEYFGKVAKCKHGKIGVIYQRKDTIVGSIGNPSVITRYLGVALDGSNWESKDPEIIADNLNSYIADTVVKPLLNPQGY